MGCKASRSADGAIVEQRLTPSNIDRVQRSLTFMDSLSGETRPHSLRSSRLTSGARIRGEGNMTDSSGSNLRGGGGGAATSGGESPHELEQLQEDLETLERLFQSLLGQSLTNQFVHSMEDNNNNNDHNMLADGTTPPAAERSVNNLPIICIAEEDLKDDSNKECCICFLEHEVGDKVARLPCGHFFHCHCIQEWLRKKCTCPVCRYEIETENEVYEVDRIERMKLRRIRIKNHELHRMTIQELQDIAGIDTTRSRNYLIDIIKELDNVDIISNTNASSASIATVASPRLVLDIVEEEKAEIVDDLEQQQQQQLGGAADIEMLLSNVAPNESVAN
jgi:hypothetical protein